jgi:hypothetical protein
MMNTKGSTMKMTKKAMAEKAVKISTIYNKSVKTKSEMRAESDAQIALFLKKGGVIQECTPSRRKIKATMSGKTTRFVSGTSGFANGFPRKSTGAQ